MRYVTLNRNTEFLRAYRRGKSFVHPFVVTYVFKKRGGATRIGITASKKTGGAVERNRARRVIRAALSEVLLQDAGGYDIVFVARSQTALQKSTALVPIIQKHLHAAGVL